jgi:hypothetical protein
MGKEVATQVLDGMVSSPEMKRLLRRSVPDHSQRIRHIVQGVFVLLNAWIGAQFYIWVRFPSAAPVPRSL